jgi:hypothetical protein
MPSAQELASSIKCWGTVLIVLGVICIADISVSIPALVVGCSVVCQSDLAVLKSSIGNIKCCAITGIVFAVIGICVGIGVGLLALTLWTGTCEAAHQLTGCSSGRRLESMMAEGLPASEVSLPDNPMMDLLPDVPRRLLEASLTWAFTQSLPQLFRIEDGVVKQLGATPKRAVDSVHRQLQTTPPPTPPPPWFLTTSFIPPPTPNPPPPTWLAAFSQPSFPSIIFPSDGDHCDDLGNGCGYLTTIGFAILIVPSLLCTLFIVAFCCVCTKGGELERIPEAQVMTGVNIPVVVGKM